MLLFVAILHSLMIISVIACGENCVLTPLSDFDNKRVTGYELWIEDDFDSHASCASKCHLNESCMSSGFSPESGKCHGYAVGFVKIELATTVTDPGFKLYPMCRATNFIGSGCVSSNDCEGQNTQCINGACTCKQGFSFRKEGPPFCIEDCPLYGSTFVAYDGKTVRFNNDRTIDNNPSTYEDCKLACVQETAWVCKSFEFDKVAKNCNLQKNSWLEYSSFNRNSNSDWVFFTRNCLL